MFGSLAAGMIAAATIAAYSNCFSGVFVLDDDASILQNATLRHLGDLRAVLTPLSGGGLTVDGRPILNLSFAINYAISGTAVWSYHAVNLLIHVLGALALFGVARRVLEAGSGRPGEPARRLAPAPFAFAVAILWAVHPLNTESVTYVAQRAESLMGLFYLLTLYCFIRYAAGRTSPRRAGSRVWAILSVLACFLGMGTKEVAVSAPIAVLLVDRLFCSGSLPGAWRARKGYYLALFSSWILLVALAWHTGSRGGTSGFGSGVSAWKYWATQPAAVMRYLKLAVWPNPLVFDYGTEWARGLAQIAGPALLTGGLLGAALYGLIRNRAWGVLGFCFFALLAPTSLVPGNRQTAAEHRMYLALIPVLIAALAAVGLLLERIARSSGKDSPAGSESRAAAGLAFLALLAAVPAAFATFGRNSDYASELRLYGDSAAKMPDNAYAQANYGTALLFAGDCAEAEAHLKAALRSDPGLQDAEDNLGNVCSSLGRYEEAEVHYRRAIRINPRFAQAHDNLAKTFLKEDRVAEARSEAEAGLRLEPNSPGAHDDLGMVLLREGRPAEALAELGRATALAPGNPDMHINLGNALRSSGQPEKACEEYAIAARLDPRSGQVYYNWGNALMDLRRNDDAEARLRLAIQFEPGNSSAHQNLGNVLLAENRPEEAVEQYAAAVKLAPDRALAHYNYANGLLRLGRREEAAAEFRKALQLDPALAPAARLLRALGG
jgi:tetratricopeptide (TPR) repeat protein